MDIKERFLYSDFDIRVKLGYLLIKVININFEPPRRLWHVEPHCHSSYELHFIPQGKGTLRIGHLIYDISPGTFYLTGPGIYHEQISDDDCPMSECCLNFEFEVLDKKHNIDSIFLESEIEEIIKALDSTNFWFGRDEFSTVNLFSQIKWELDNKKIGYFAAIQNLVAQIVINAARCYRSPSKVEYEMPQKSLDEKRRFIIDGFFRGYERDLSPLSLAQELGLSERQLNRTMQEYFSMSFKEKLIQIRLDHAKDLLVNTDLSIEQIAEKVGFSNIGYFYRIFKEKALCTPAAYKRNNRKDVKHKEAAEEGLEEDEA